MNVPPIPVKVNWARKNTILSLLQEVKFGDKNFTSGYFHFMERKRTESLLKILQYISENKISIMQIHSNKLVLTMNRHRTFSKLLAH